MSILMTEKSSYVGNFGRLLSELDQASNTVDKLSKTPSSISPKEVDQMIEAFEQYNRDFSDKGLKAMSGKTLIQKQMDEGINNYLKALEIFKQNFSQNNPALRKDVGQTMQALFTKLDEEMKKFGKTLRELKDRKNIKIGQRVEKSTKSNLLKEKK